MKEFKMKRTFKIATRNGAIEVKISKLIERGGLMFAVHKSHDYDAYNISEYKTGYCVIPAISRLYRSVDELDNTLKNIHPLEEIKRALKYLPILNK